MPALRPRPSPIEVRRLIEEVGWLLSERYVPDSVFVAFVHLVPLLVALVAAIESEVGPFDVDEYRNYLEE